MNMFEAFVADMVQLCHNMRVHSIIEQPSGSCMFKLGIMQVTWPSFGKRKQIDFSEYDASFDFFSM